jgi:hypothetical protein
MKKNADFHFVAEKELKDKLEKEANVRGISFAELCRERLRGNSELTEIKTLLQEFKGRADFGKRSTKICIS